MARRRRAAAGGPGRVVLVAVSVPAGASAMLVAKDYDCATPSGERYPARLKALAASGSCDPCISQAAACADAVAVFCDRRTAQMLGTGGCVVYGDGAPPQCAALQSWQEDLTGTGQGLPPKKGPASEGWECYAKADCTTYTCAVGLEPRSPAPACPCCDAGCTPCGVAGAAQTCSPGAQSDAACCISVTAAPSAAPSAQPSQPPSAPPAVPPPPVKTTTQKTVGALSGIDGSNPGLTAGVAVATAAGGGAQSLQRTGALMRSCSIEEDVDPDIAPWSPGMSPEPFSDALLGNALLLLFTFAAHSLVVLLVWLWRQRASWVPEIPTAASLRAMTSLGKGLNSSRDQSSGPRWHTRQLRDARALVRHPSLLLLLYIFLYPGSAICAWKLLFYGSAGGQVLGLGVALAVLTAMPIVTVNWVRGLDATYADAIPQSGPSGPRGLQQLVGAWRDWGERYMLGGGEWVSTSHRRPVQCYGMLFEQYRSGMRWFLFVEQVSLLLVTLLASIESGACAACAGVSGANAVVLIAWLAVCAKVRPWASQFENHYNLIAAAIQLSAAALAALSVAWGQQLDRSCDVDHWTKDTSDMLLMVCTFLALAKLGIDVVLFLYSQGVRRQQRLQEKADSSLKAQTAAEEDEREDQRLGQFEMSCDLSMAHGLAGGRSRRTLGGRRSTIGANIRLRRSSVSSGSSHSEASSASSQERGVSVVRLARYVSDADPDSEGDGHQRQHAVPSSTKAALRPGNSLHPDRAARLDTTPPRRGKKEKFAGALRRGFTPRGPRPHFGGLGSGRVPDDTSLASMLPTVPDATLCAPRENTASLAPASRTSVTLSLLRQGSDNPNTPSVLSGGGSRSDGHSQAGATPNHMSLLGPRRPPGKGSRLSL
eukprot:TRINITY_DN44829_c0_g1_i1.p1 TRINITY_DN44829_c0_g1~~TRINITY_DN44829_c0_g1_i1.p1  ORF type:complete len:880 (+),score=202.40 TRINITY_DN44829_c0_g1_i1:78-2717(+)